MNKTHHVETRFLSIIQQGKGSVCHVAKGVLSNMKGEVVILSNGVAMVKDENSVTCSFAPAYWLSVTWNPK